MKVTDNLIKQFVRERDEAVKTFDLDVFKAFYEKWKQKGLYQIDLPKNEKVLEITMRKMAVHSTGIPQDIRDEAAEWLISRGYSTDLM